MTYTFKLARRIARLRRTAPVLAGAFLLLSAIGCTDNGASDLTGSSRPEDVLSARGARGGKGLSDP